MATRMQPRRIRSLLNRPYATKKQKRNSSRLSVKNLWPPGLFNRFPNEIALSIASHLPDHDALSLAKTDNRRYELIIPLIYRRNMQTHNGDALLWAACLGSADGVRRALAAGADVNEEHSISLDKVTLGRWDPNSKRTWTSSLDPDFYTTYFWLSNTPLSAATIHGSADIVRILLEAGADVTPAGWGEYGRQRPMTALFEAAEGGHVEIFRLLLEAKGADINVKDGYGDGMLAAAVRSGSVAMTKHVFEILQDDLPPEASGSDSPLICAIHSRNTDMVNYMLSTGKFDVNRVSGEPTPLQAAAKSIPEILDLFLDHPDVDLTAEDSRGRSAMTAMLEVITRDCIESLLQRPGIPVDPFSAFEAACRISAPKAIDRLIGSKTIPKSPCSASGRTWMHVVAEYSLSWAVTALNRIDKNMLHTQCNDGNTPVSEAVRYQPSLETVKKMLRFKADIGIANNRGETPLHKSCLEKNAYSTKELLARGANIHAKTNLGQTPLHMAACKARNVEVVKLLIHAGASVIEPDNDGNTPIGVASGSGHGFEQMVSEMRKALEKSDDESGRQPKKRRLNNV